ncbi:unnamed protein product, partial [Meganyctiphanes norvegica]
MVCKHSGEYNPTNKLHTSQVERRNKSTIKTKCPFHLNIYITKDGKHLRLNKILEEHNHILDISIFNNYPENRKLDKELEKKVIEMLAVKGDKKMIQSYLQKQHDKTVTARDLANLSNKAMKTKSSSFPDFIKIVSDTPGIDYALLLESNSCVGIFFQTATMKSTFDAYSKMIFVDSTYKVNDLCMPLTVFMCLDGNGESEIIALALVKNENIESVSWIAEKFVEKNPSYVKVQCIMADKDFVERKVFSSFFPGAIILVCIFHTLRIFKRTITELIMNIDTSKKEEILEILQNIVFAKSLDECNSLITALKENSPQNVIDYFTKNWEETKHQWVKGLQTLYRNFYNLTNNRVESINAKIKSVIKHYPTMTQFFSELMIVVKHYETERDNRAIKAFVNTPIEAPETEDLLYYSKLL